MSICVRALALSSLLFVVHAPADAAESGIYGVWRGTLTLAGPPGKDARIETKAALHLHNGAPSEIYVDNLGRALPVSDLFRTPSGATDIYAGRAPSIELRGIKFGADQFEATAIEETETHAVLRGKAVFRRVKPLSAPSGKPSCAGAPASLAVLCGTWSGISLRGQPKLLAVERITRNKQKVAWELKARQEWGGESDLASAGMEFPYTVYITDQELPLATLALRTTGRLAYRFDIGTDTLTGGSITDAADRTVYERAGR